MGDPVRDSKRWRKHADRRRSSKAPSWERHHLGVPRGEDRRRSRRADVRRRGKAPSWEMHPPGSRSKVVWA